MTIYDLKPRFQSLLRPACRAMANAGISANQVTLMAALLSFAMGALIWGTHGAAGTLVLVPVVLFIRMALNAIDGMLAREHNMKSPLGSLLNEVGDVVSDAAIYLPFMIIPGVPGMLIVLVVLLGIVSELTGLAAVQIGASRRYDGPMGKSDRAFVFGALGLLLGLGVSRGRWVDAVLGGVITLLVITIWNRGTRALKEVSR